MSLKYTKGIPVLVSDCIINLEQRNAKNIEGIFRVSGSARDVKKILKIYNKGGRAELHRVDLHTVAALLKSFLNDPKTPPIINQMTVEDILSVTDLTDDERVQKLKSALMDLPIANKETLYRLVPFLTRVIENAETNKMDSKNLAKIFGPILLRRKGQTPQEFFKSIPQIVDVTASFLVHSAFIFERIPLSSKHEHDIAFIINTERKRYI
eukprot:TRINITY_DN1669_c0_g1_i1.p1 TRINITY_DN1669_c0_g1~~TRINITY_DN1669_c0_g1_i1.p1  ORF type:complete len:210 (+),score=22.44 TRINITY_DN1669_c0_g1_i1:37-666(+)